MALPPLKSPSGFTSHPPLPEGLSYGVHFTRTEGQFPSRTGRGQLWYAAFWPATAPPPRGLVVFVHGVHEHSERYHHVLTQFAARGYVAAACDLVGHGRSEGLRGDAESLDDFLLDVEAFIAMLRGQVGDVETPTFIWGQSMGGLLVSLLALRDGSRTEGPRLKGVVVTSGAIDVEKGFILALQEKLAPLLVRVIPRARIVAAVKPEEMSSDPEEVERYVKDPLNTIGNLRVLLAFKVAEGMKYLAEHAPALKVPMLVLHGTEDKCTHMPAAENLVKIISSEVKEFVPKEGLFHTLLHEPRRQEVVDEMLRFFDRVTGGTTAGAPPLRSKL